MEDTDQVLMDNPNIYVYRLIVYATQRLIRRFLNSVYFRTLDVRSKERNGVYLACVDSLKGWVSLSFSKNYACFVYLYAYAVQNLFNAS